MGWHWLWFIKALVYELFADPDGDETFEMREVLTEHQHFEYGTHSLDFRCT